MIRIRIRVRSRIRIMIMMIPGIRIQNRSEDDVEDHTDN